MSIVLFKMWEPFRETLIAEHCFYVEQSRKRLLSQFENIEAEADMAVAEHLQSRSIHFDPDRHDPSDLEESAHDKGIEFYELLSDMRESVRLSVISGMFHQWDKRLRDWIVSEVRHWRFEDFTAGAIWTASFSDIVELFASVGFDVKALPCHANLDVMRLIVNVFKHGDGGSLDELKISHREFLPDPLCEIGGLVDLDISYDFIDHTHLKVTDVHLALFSNAILAFWSAVPEHIFYSETPDIGILEWFEKAESKASKYKRKKIKSQ